MWNAKENSISAWIVCQYQKSTFKHLTFLTKACSILNARSHSEHEHFVP